MSLNLYALIFQLHPARNATLPAMVGTQAHAAFLSLIRDVDPPLAEWLHEDHGQIKPFGVSLLAPHSVLRERGWEVQTGSTVRLRVTVAGRWLYEALLARFLQGQYELRLGHASFQTGRVIANDPAEPLAGYSTMADLWQAAIPAPKQTLRIVMPTTWKEGPSGQAYWVMVPTPMGVYKSLSQAWATYALHDDPDLKFDYKPLLAGLEQTAVTIAAQSTQTIHWQSENPPTAGMIGKVTYRVGGNETFRRTIDLLTRFSFFVGVGNSRGRGLGVVAPEARE